MTITCLIIDLMELKQSSGMSYTQVAIKTKLYDTYLINIVKRKNLTPNDENKKKHHPGT